MSANHSIFIVYKKVCHIIATLGFIGYIPVAPGTFGSLFGFILAFLLKPSDVFIALFLIALFIIGTLSSHEAEKRLGKDSGHIVIDELAGYVVSILFIPKDAGYLVAALLIFRFFDIAKPFPIRKLERSLSGGIGIMLDDIVAGIFTNICLQTAKYIV